MFVNRNQGKCCGLCGGKKDEEDVLHILKKGTFQLYYTDWWEGKSSFHCLIFLSVMYLEQEGFREILPKIMIFPKGAA